jgi:hypothetical protein
VNLDELERMLKAQFPGTDVACGGLDDHLYIFATREDVLPEMRTFLSQKTGLNMAGFHTQPLETIPKNDAGKTLYRELEQYVH